MGSDFGSHRGSCQPSSSLQALQVLPQLLPGLGGVARLGRSCQPREEELRGHSSASDSPVLAGERFCSQPGHGQRLPLEAALLPAAGLQQEMQTLGILTLGKVPAALLGAPSLCGPPCASLLVPPVPRAGCNCPLAAGLGRGCAVGGSVRAGLLFPANNKNFPGSFESARPWLLCPEPAPSSQLQLLHPT